MNQPRLVAAISNISMALGHDGLSECAKRLGIKIDKLEDHELVLFVNRARDRLKVLGAKGIVLGYVKMPKGRKLPLGAVQFIPATFSGQGTIDIDAAIAKYITKTLEKKSIGPIDIAKAMKH